MYNFKNYNNYYELEFVIYGDKRVSSWPLMNNPAIIIIIMLIYIYLIYKLGPKFMENRKPYDIKWILAIYNLSQIIACFYLIYSILAVTPDIYYKCPKVDYTDSVTGLNELKCTYFTLLLKLFELIETIFFVIRKKQNQISKLHVYHHISTASLSWIMVKYIGGGMILSSILLNSCIHVIMYGYYFAALFGKHFQKKLAFIKKSITTIQMIQFTIILLQIIYCYINGCAVPPLLIFLYVPNVIILYYFFYNFYRKSYSVENIKLKE